MPTRIPTKRQTSDMLSPITKEKIDSGGVLGNKQKKLNSKAPKRLYTDNCNNENSSKEEFKSEELPLNTKFFIF